MKRILFVDDEASILTGLGRALRGLRKEWEMVFAEGGDAALKQCEAAPLDVVVSDARMPGMEGSELLGEVMRRHPDTVRFILSGQCSRDSVLKCVDVAHQFLNKPCEPDVLKSAVQRVCEMRGSFRDRPTRMALSRLQWLPSQARVYQELCSQLESGEASLESVGKILGRDVATSAKLLQLVSSGFFGTPQHVRGAGQAAGLLGLDTIRALARSAVFQPCSLAAWEEALRCLNEHSMAVAAAAKAIAQTITEARALIGDAYVAGMLHEIAALALGEWAAAPGCHPMSPEGRVGNGPCAPDPGAYLVALWGLPQTIVQAVAYRAAPSACVEGPSVPLTAVHAAHVLLLLGPSSGSLDESSDALDMAYLQRTDCAARVPEWRELCQTLCPEGVLLSPRESCALTTIPISCWGISGPCENAIRSRWPWAARKGWRRSAIRAPTPSW
jgi:HD-like signal output (HDOD) protein